MQIGTVVAIHISLSAGATMELVSWARAIEYQGLHGDRYAKNCGSYSKKSPEKRQVTLIEQETLDALARDHNMTVDPSQTRRNITTRGIALNHLVGRQFMIAGVIFEGVELCEPCGRLESLTGIKGIKNALVHRGGLRALVLKTGTIHTGCQITLMS